MQNVNLISPHQLHQVQDTFLSSDTSLEAIVEEVRPSELRSVNSLFPLITKEN